MKHLQRCNLFSGTVHDWMLPLHRENGLCYTISQCIYKEQCFVISTIPLQEVCSPSKPTVLYLAMSQSQLCHKKKALQNYIIPENTIAVMSPIVNVNSALNTHLLEPLLQRKM